MGILKVAGKVPGEDIRSEQRSRNVRNTLSRLLELGAQAGHGS